MNKINLADALKSGKCWRCRGDGSYWICDAGFNPFFAGAHVAAAAARKVDPCFECNGTGWLSPASRPERALEE